MIHIAYCFDRNYRAHFGASITSLLLNSLSDKREILIHVLTDEVDQTLEDSLNRLRRSFGVGINTYMPTPDQLLRFSRVPLLSHTSVASYFRLLLPELLSSDIQKLLYLDSDTIVLADVAELYGRDIEGFTIAGALDYSNIGMSARLSLNKYVNSGVLLFDIDRWNSADYTSKCIDFADMYPEKIYYADQCVVNQVLRDDIAILEPSWNKYITHRSPESTAEGAAILHFITSNKPWQGWYESPVSKYYWQYLTVSPWKGTNPVLPKTIAEGWRYARKLRNSGQLLESIGVYDNLMKSIAAKQASNSPKKR